MSTAWRPNPASAKLVVEFVQHIAVSGTGQVEFKFLAHGVAFSAQFRVLQIVFTHEQEEFHGESDFIMQRFKVLAVADQLFKGTAVERNLYDAEEQPTTVFRPGHRS